MAIFTKESLDHLRQKIDLVETLESFVELKRAGASYKGLCPFHDEKTPSFVVQKGDTHYHCFGCGAHGDAIAFLMTKQHLSFSDAVEFLAEKFHVHLEQTELHEVKGPPKKLLRDALNFAARLYHTLLLYTEDGHKALQYLHKRGLNLNFIKRFEIGYAPKDPHILQPLLKSQNIPHDIAEACGLLRGNRDFFTDRILFPIRASAGHVIGFSGRKFKEETTGGKYVNTPETPLFKKSRVLFGLNYSRQRIAKERVALIVEGQIDALRLIDNGLDYTVAGQGTAFGAEHVAELLTLGVLTVYLAFDSDQAGINAAVKVGDLFQKQGVEVKIVSMPEGSDPDQFIREKGKEAFENLLKNADDYLTLLVRYHSKEIDLTTPAGKNELAKLLGKQIRAWDHPLMVHESLRKLAHVLQVPESMLGVGQPEVSNIYLKKYDYAGVQSIDPDWVLEVDLLRWLIRTPLNHPFVHSLAKEHLTEAFFRIPVCQTLFRSYFEALQEQKPIELLSVICLLEEGIGQKLLEELTHKKIPLEKADRLFVETLQKILDRNWLAEREKIRQQIQSGNHSDEEALLLAQQFESKRATNIKILLKTQ